MHFKNATFFTLPAVDSFEGAWRALDQATADCQLKPVGPLELSSSGFVYPFQASDDEIALPWVDHSLQVIFLAVGTEERVLPPSAVNAALEKAVAAFEAKEGRKPGSKLRKQLKEDLVHEMLPRAFVKPGRITGYLDFPNRLVVIDTSSRKKAEQFIGEIRRALGSFPALPVNAEVAPRAVMTAWLAERELPDDADGDPLLFNDSVTLKEGANGAAARITGQSLDGEEVEKHLEAGKQVVRIGLASESMTFQLDESLQLRSIKLHDSDVPEDVAEDADAFLRAQVFMLVSAMRETWTPIAKAFKITPAE